MHFEYPWILLFGLLFLFCERKCPLRLELLLFPHIDRIAKISHNRSFMQALKWMAWSGLIVALASPVTTKRFVPSTLWSRDMVLIIDTSRSMDEPFSIVQKENKFQALQKVLKAFVEKREEDRIGMVVFGEYAYIASPITADKRLLMQMIPHLKVGMAGERTAISDALVLGVKLLKKSHAKSRVAILMTDGKNTEGKVPMAVAEKVLKTYGIKLYTIGIGYGGNYDAKSLERLARETGGRFFEASDPKMLEQVYREIDRLEPSRVEGKPVVETRYYYIYPLFIAAMSLLGWLFLLNRSEVA
ncbi:VWA domain-containing protein [Hydrogenimonas sp. SS33]|uniref:VWA domain-containing protein n=1 Tax=Hydrogenimonas leucolamina TaxID=2954236 RepID=UPI00336BD8E6